jgi:hypothetical protein
LKVNTKFCKGIKTVEDRAWNTKYRGKLLIHASGKPLVWPELKYMPLAFPKHIKNTTAMTLFQRIYLNHL